MIRATRKNPRVTGNGPGSVAAGDDARIVSAVASVVLLPAASGTDDTSAINAVLAASSGLRVVGRAGASYLTSAPIIIYSGTTLDMTGCKVTLKAGSNCNMIQNVAVSASRRFLDAAMTSGSATLTSATGAFVSGDAGKVITIQGAGASGVPLTTTISSVTNSTTVSLATTAGATVTGQYAAIGARNSNITVIDGTWDRANNGSSPSFSVDAHTMRFRHVDGLIVRAPKMLGISGKYAINPGDCTRIRVSDVDLVSYASDGVHLNGPCSQVSIERIFGNYMGDDLVSMTARDSTAVITDCAGDITDVFVDTAHSSGVDPALFSSVLKVVAGKTTDGSADYAVRRVSAKNITGPTTSAYVVYIGDSSGGTFDDISLEDVRSLGGSAIRGCVQLNSGSLGRIKLKNLTPAPTDGVAVSCGASVASLTIDGILWAATSVSPIGISHTTGTIGDLSIENVLASASTGEIVRIGSGATITRLALDKVSVNTMRPINAALGCFLGSAVMSNIRTVNTAYPLGYYQTTTTIEASNVVATGMTGWLYAPTPGGLVTVRGASGLSGDVDAYFGNVLMAVRNNSVLSGDPTVLASGEETVNRLLANTSANTSSGNLVLTYFTARKGETTANVRTLVGNGAAAGATLCRIGLYSVDGGGALTLVASTANDTTLWSGTFGASTRAWTTPYTKVVGQQYALGLLFVGTTGPKWYCALPVLGTEMAMAPKICGTVTGQTDLPSSITAGSVGNSSGIAAYAAILP